MINNLSKLNDNISNDKASIYNDAKSALAFYSRLKFIIPSIIIIIISIIIFIYGIKLIYKDESNIKSTKVNITKIVNSNDLTKSCQDKIIRTTFNDDKKSRVSENTVYNCIIYFNLFGNERMIHILDSDKNYSIGEEITIWYDNSNMNELLLSYYSLKKYKYIFISQLFIIIPLILCINYIIYNNERLALGLGVYDIINNIFNKQ